MDHLKLVALDKDDIEVVSAHLQDAVVKVADIRWRPAEKRLVIGAQPLRLGGGQRHGSPEFRRRRAALRFERVSACKCRNCTRRREGPGAEPARGSFEETDQPAGVVTLTFSGGAALAARGRVPRGRTGRSWPVLGHRLLPGAHVDATAKSSRRPPNRVDAPARRGPLTGATGARPGRTARDADTPRQPIRGFCRALCRFSRHQARDRRGRRAGGARHHRRRPQERRPRADRAQPRNSTASISTSSGCACRRREIDAATEACDASRARRADARARPHRGLSPAAEAVRRPLHRSRSASSSATAGPRSRRSASTCRAAPRPIRRRC